MTHVRVPVLLVFVLSLVLAAYLGFASIQLKHDKLVHFSTFAILTAEFYFIFDTKSLKTLRVFTLFICTFGGGVFSEILQHLVNPARVFDIVDIFYNLGGSVFGLILSVVLHQWHRRKNYRSGKPHTIIVTSSSESDLPIAEDYVVVEMKELDGVEQK